MRRVGLFVAALCAVAAILAPGARAFDRQDYAMIARGRYLATVADCAACHTQPGGPPYGGGRPLQTPFGKLLAPNLTSDRDTGIGDWSVKDFVNAVRIGRGHHGQRLYPAMPYVYYTRMSDDDVVAIRAYLDTLPPVHNPVKSNQLPFPFNIRFFMWFWNGLFFHPHAPQTNGKPAQWIAGENLVDGAGHCGMCHTPKNFLGADKGSKAFQGAVLQDWFAPNLTGDPRRGIAAWSTADIVSYLKTGANKMTLATGPMAEVVVDSTAHWRDADLEAAAAYLKSLAPAGGRAAQPLKTDEPVMRQGQAIYVDACAACHGPSGAPIPGLIAGLKGSTTVQSDDPTTLIRLVLAGTQAVVTDPVPTGAEMPGQAWRLSDSQVAAVLTYIRNSWGNAASGVDASAVKHLRGRLSGVSP